MKSLAMDRELLISTGIGCGVLCSYCPQVTIGQAYKKVSGPSSLSFDTYRTCVDKLPEDVIVNFTGFYEPFLNQACTDMILYAVEKGHEVRLSTTVMGLTAEQVDRFKHIEFVKFAVHLPDTKGLTRIIVDDTYMAALARLIKSDISNIGFHVHEGQEGPEAVHETVDALLIENDIEPENRWILTRAGNIDIDGVAPPVRLTGELALCPRLYENVLLPSGDIALCCMDWDLKHVIGNLLETEYENLFTGPQFKEVLRAYSDDSMDILCRTCEVARTKKDVRISEFKAYVEAQGGTSVAGGAISS
ncbi:radical SAM/SPASM domain-containing protein [Pontixanthobacter gangjinensis]|uniref:4Fe4S-binding SPASM domain-containing protein n=1 Tax=Pontixanthobacter gangjinensis TaxID=1028742 RepID=A0A6I4SKC6_9SPHN|nr:SPASM domain-containing protein [Pontixanthobacter gangjinensis]MXO55590.1 hypothetical protein [Pontixanthobacter gangjinensis]